MRRFLILLALAYPVAMASPMFWSLVAMAWTASPVTYINHDGTAQQATIGPKSFWPEWAIKPDGADVRVQSWFGPSARAAATGVGEFKTNEEPRAAAGRYTERLRAEGWEIETGRFDSVYPSVPPRPLVRCIVRATRGEQLISASFEAAPEPSRGQLFWAEKPAPDAWPMPHGTSVGPC